MTEEHDDLFGAIDNFLAGVGNSEAILYTDEEYEQLIVSFLTAQGEGAEVPEDDILALIRKCESVALSWSMIQLALKGFALINLDEDGEINLVASEEGLALWKNSQQD